VITCAFWPFKVIQCHPLLHKIESLHLHHNTLASKTDDRQRQRAYYNNSRTLQCNCNVQLKTTRNIYIDHNNGLILYWVIACRWTTNAANAINVHYGLRLQIYNCDAVTSLQEASAYVWVRRVEDLRALQNLHFPKDVIRQFSANAIVTSASHITLQLLYKPNSSA